MFHKMNFGNSVFITKENEASVTEVYVKEEPIDELSTVAPDISKICQTSTIIKNEHSKTSEETLVETQRNEVTNYPSSGMDVEHLISLVFEKRSLWDSKERNYHKRDVKKRLWEEISDEMDITADAARKKWNGLRDTFRKELNKFQKKKSGEEGGAIRQSLWPYYTSLLFLKDPMEGRNMHSSLSLVNTEKIPSPIETEDDMLSNDSQEARFQINSVAPPVKTPITCTPKLICHPNKKTSKRNNIMQKLIKIENNILEENRKQKSSPKCCKEDDPDYHFLMSLLPYLRKVPESRKMIVRTRLQQIFCDEENIGNLNASASCTAVSSACSFSPKSEPSTSSVAINYCSPPVVSKPVAQSNFSANPSPFPVQTISPVVPQELQVMPKSSCQLLDISLNSPVTHNNV